MKRSNICRFTMTLLFLLLFTFPLYNGYAAASDNPVEVYADGYRVPFTQPPFLEDGVVWGELLPFLETVGMQTEWEAETQMVTATYKGSLIELNVNSSEIKIFGYSKPLAFVPRVINDAVFVPLKPFVEVLGEVSWVESDNRIKIVFDKGYPTYVAAKNNDLEQATYSLSHRGGANFVNRDDGSTTLSWAMHHKNTEMIDLLLQYGADPNHEIAVSGESVSPLEAAVMDKDPKLVQLLLEYGADVTSSDREGTALDLARITGQKAVSESDKQKMQQIIALLQRQQEVVSLADQRVLIPYNAGGKMNLFKGEYGHWGYFDQTGKKAIRPKFALAYPFSEGLAYAVSKDLSQAGYIDRTGKFVITLDLSARLYAGDFKEGLAAVRKDGKWGFIDRQGNFVIAPKYEIVFPFSEGLARFAINNKVGFINRSGEEVIEPKYTSASEFLNGMAHVEGDERGFINTKGELVIDFEQLGLSVAGGFFGEYAPVFKNGKAGYINKQGEFAIPPIYYGAGNFREGLAAVTFDGKSYGYIDKSAQMVITPQYDFAAPFRNGQALVKVNGKWGFINPKGETIVSPSFDGFDGILGAGPLWRHDAFSDEADGMAILRKSDQTFYVLPDGKIIEFSKTVE
ncbi:WG repeat-containing protein [Paenibacillus hamazuiensis]|uniref:WG repeat-containing protein n=1 Tax=Paenibacillus hamazuiensis TaxID=2936508 RepID=UPI00200F60FB|nr:WG repeat-containing protein [Paenibacillus hamazuiensis]